MSALLPGQNLPTWLIAGLLCLQGPTAEPADSAKQPASRDGTASVATCGPVAGVLLKRATPDGPWHFVDEKDAIYPDILLVALPDATFYSANHNVQVNMIADIGHRGPLPVFESAVRFHHDPKVDLDVTVERGIVAFTNLKAAGAARVRVRVADQTWDLTLREPGSKVGLEIHGRNAPGPPQFIPEEGNRMKVKDPPTMEVYLLVVKGRASLEADNREITLDAPPGPGKLHWDNVAKKIEVIHLDKLPESIAPKTPEEVKLYQEICVALRTLRDGPIDNVLEKALESDQPLSHRGAVVLLGALDKLPRLVNVLATSKYAEARDKSIVVLRNWLGRGPGQAEKLYDYLTTDRKLTPPQAKTAIHLLFGFDEDEQRQPDTYEVLIQCLKHSKLAVRELARWHLVRLAPEGKSIEYDAGAAPEQRERAYEQWRALIPAGQLPPHLRAKVENK
jgi:hypothetical protein